MNELEARLFNNIFGMSWEDAAELGMLEKEHKQLIDDEYEECVRYAAAHGWESSRHEKGMELKSKIYDIKKRNNLTP